MMINMRKELDKVKNAMKGKIAINLDGMIKRIAFWSAPYHLNFVSHSWRVMMALKIP